MTTQKHLNRERESCPLLNEKCSPHVFLICLKFFSCHECALLSVDSRTCGLIIRLDSDLVLIITHHVSSRMRGIDRTCRHELELLPPDGEMES